MRRLIRHRRKTKERNATALDVPVIDDVELAARVFAEPRPEPKAEAADTEVNLTVQSSEGDEAARREADDADIAVALHESEGDASAIPDAHGCVTVSFDRAKPTCKQRDPCEHAASTFPSPGLGSRIR